MKMKPHIRQAVLDYQWNIFFEELLQRIEKAGGTVDSEAWSVMSLKDAFVTLHNNGIYLKIVGRGSNE